MLEILLLILIILWFFGYIRIEQIPIPDLYLFSINGNQISLWDLLILTVVAWAISILPTPFRQIAGVVLILWILAVLGIIALAGINLASIFVIAIIVGLIFALFSSPSLK